VINIRESAAADSSFEARPCSRDSLYRILS
jgi:hypothetical protein